MTSDEGEAIFDKALVPFDGSTEVDRILPSVARLAGGLHMPLVLASVLDHGPTSTLEQRRQGADHHVQEMVTRLAGAGVEATAVIAVGRSVQKIVRLVEQEGCNLLLLLPRGEVAHAWGALGSITEQMMQAAPVPILSMPLQEVAPDRSEAGPITTVIVPLDGSSLAEMALPYAEELAQKLAAEVMLTRAVSPSHVYRGTMVDAPCIDPRAMEATESEATAYLERVADQLRVKGFAVRPLGIDAAVCGVDARGTTPHCRGGPPTRVSAWGDDRPGGRADRGLLHHPDGPG